MQHTDPGIYVFFFPPEYAAALMASLRQSYSTSSVALREHSAALCASAPAPLPRAMQSVSKEEAVNRYRSRKSRFSKSQWFVYCVIYLLYILCPFWFNNMSFAWGFVALLEGIPVLVCIKFVFFVLSVLTNTNLFLLTMLLWSACMLLSLSLLFACQYCN